MTLPCDTHLAYVLPHEAWYWDAIRSLDRNRRSISVMASAQGGGVAWEFSIEEYADLGPRLKMFEDSWTAFVQMPWFFAALADVATFDQVRDLLDRLGATDETTRINPYENAQPTAGDLT